MNFYLKRSALMIHLTALMDEDLEAILKIAIFPCLLNLFHFKSSHQFCFNRLLHQWGFNVDEVIFSNSTKLNYSWGFKGKVNVPSNIGFTGSLAMFRAITSKGVWSFSNLTQNNNSEEFLKFINWLMDWLLDYLKIKIEHLMYMIDNNPVYTPINSMKNLNNLKCQVVFLPPYWPQLASIEIMFNVMKRKIFKHLEGEIIKLCLKDGMRTIKEILATFANGQIMSFLTKTMKEANEWLEDLGSKDKLTLKT